MQSPTNRRVRSWTLIILTALTCVCSIASASASNNLAPPFKTKWARLFRGGLEYHSINNGVLYYAASDGMGALRLSSGQQIWQIGTKDDDAIGSAVFDRSRAYFEVYGVGIEAHSLVNGKKLWQVPTKSDVSNLYVYGNRLYCGLRPGHVSAINLTDGKIVWDISLPNLNASPNWYVSGMASIADHRLIILSGSEGSGRLRGFSIACVSESSGKTAWSISRKPELVGGLSGDALDEQRLYVSFQDGRTEALSLRDGTPLWTQKDIGRPALVDGNEVISTDDGALGAFSCTTGQKLWSRILSKEAWGGRLEPSISAGNIIAMGDRTLYCISPTGEMKWSWLSQDTYPGRAPVLTAHGFLLEEDTSLCMFEHGLPPPLPRSIKARRALTTRLISHLDSLNADEKHRLISLGADAFPALLAALKTRIYIYTSSHDSNKFDGVYNCMEYVDAMMQPQFTQALLNMLPAPTGDMSVREELLGPLAEKGDPALTLPLFLNILQTETPYWGSRNSPSSLALQVICSSKSYSAVQYRISAISNPKESGHIRRAAYISLGGSGNHAAVAAVLAARNHERNAQALSDAMQLSQVGLKPGSYSAGGGASLVVTAKDSSGQLWGLVQSAIAGNEADLWIVREDRGHWSNPIFTNHTATKQVSPESLIKYVHDPDFTRDSDGDGWTDLLEQRLGTSPNSKDIDGDGTIDSADKNPLAANGPRTETERVIAAAFEAHFWSPEVRPFPVVVTFPKSIAPFELCGSNWLILGIPYGTKSTLDPMFNHGTAFVTFEAPKTDFDGNAYKPADPADIILWNAQHTRAKILITDYFGSLSGSGSDIDLRKFGADWVVVDEKLQFES